MNDAQVESRSRSEGDRITYSLGNDGGTIGTLLNLDDQVISMTWPASRLDPAVKSMLDSLVATVREVAFVADPGREEVHATIEVGNETFVTVYPAEADLGQAVRQLVEEVRRATLVNLRAALDREPGHTS